MNRHNRDLLESNLARSAVNRFEELVRWRWKDMWNLSQVESSLDNPDYKAKRPNEPYTELLLNRYWWWYASGWINATRDKMGAPSQYIFRVKFYDEEEVELTGKDFTDYCNARKNIDVEYIDVLYHRGRFNSKGAVKKFLYDEMELNEGEPNAGK